MKPLAEDLEITVNSEIDRDEAATVAGAAKGYGGPGNVLVCWEHGQLSAIAEAMGAEGYAKRSGWSGPIDYPDDRFDLIWTMSSPYQVIDSVTSEGIPGLDSARTGEPVAKGEIASS